jgi:hypothetical protein
MRHDEFEIIRQSLGSGSDKRVKHIVLHQIGKIVACLPDDYFEVELDNGQHKTWSKDNVKLVH